MSTYKIVYDPSFTDDNYKMTGFTGYVFEYHGVSKITRRPIVNVDGWDYVEFRTRHSTDLITKTGLIAYLERIELPKADQSYLIKGAGFYLSTGNSKIKQAGKNNGLRKPSSAPMPSIISCQFAGACKEYCYSANVNNTYLGTLKQALHNYALVQMSTLDELVALIETAVKQVGSELVRIHDSGDFVDVKHLSAWVKVAEKNPSILFYGYSKNTPALHAHVSATQQGRLPQNMRITISSTDNVTSSEYGMRLQKEYQFNTVYILETADEISQWFDAGLPFNDVENEAIAGRRDFAISLHGTFKKDTPEFLANAKRIEIETTHNVELC